MTILRIDLLFTNDENSQGNVFRWQGEEEEE